MLNHNKLVPHPIYTEHQALQVNEKLAGCPFQMPAMKQSTIGGTAPTITPVPCGSWCALFEVHNNVAKLNCSPTPTAVKLLNAIG